MKRKQRLWKQWKQYLDTIWVCFTLCFVCVCAVCPVSKWMFDKLIAFCAIFALYDPIEFEIFHIVVVVVNNLFVFFKLNIHT